MLKRLLRIFIREPTAYEQMISRKFGCKWRFRMVDSQAKRLWDRQAGWMLDLTHVYPVQESQQRLLAIPTETYLVATVPHGRGSALLVVRIGKELYSFMFGGPTNLPAFRVNMEGDAQLLIKLHYDVLPWPRRT